MIKTYRHENLVMLAEAISEDEYDEQLQVDAFGSDPQETLDFLNRNLNELGQKPIYAEIGCGGSGRLLGKLNGLPKYLVDPSKAMIERLTKKIEGKYKIILLQAYVECLPEQIQYMDAIVFMNGFFQVRSDYEALIEINRALRVGGRFLFNLLTDDNEDIICGRVLGAKNYIRLAEEFGFGLIEYRKDKGNIALEKLHNFYPAKLRKLQLRPLKEGNYQLLNYVEERDRKFV